MQAASALLANAISAPGGESGAAPDASGGGDAFTSALAALMSVLGHAPPTQQTSAASGGGSGGSGAAGSAATAFFQPTTGSTAAATASAAVGPLGGVDTGPMADALQALASVVTELEAAQQAAQAAGDAAPITVQASGGDASQAGASGSADGGAAVAAASDDPLAALLSQLEAASDAANGASEPAAPTTANPAPSSAPALDPQLIRFVARGTASATDPSAATETTSAAADGAANATQVDAQTGQQAASATDALTSADDAAAAPDQAPANPAASGLIVFNPAGQLAQIAASAQPSGRAAATRLSASVSATTTADAAAKPAGPAIDPRAASIALFDDRGDADEVASVPGGGGDPAGDDSDPGSGDASAGAGTTAFELAPGAATVPALIPQAAAALAQAHGAEVTAQLAAQIASKAGAVRSSFDFSLDPQGLGRVDVSLKIDQQGQLSAVLSFDNPAVAAEARARAGDLQQALQQAGFDVSQSGLSFTGGQGQDAAFQGAQPSYGSGPGFADNATPDLPIISATLAAASNARRARHHDLRPKRHDQHQRRPDQRRGRPVHLAHQRRASGAARGNQLGVSRRAQHQQRARLAGGQLPELPVAADHAAAEPGSAQSDRHQPVHPADHPMTGVEQQLMSNQLLQQLVAQQTGIGAAAGLIGDTVTAPGATSSDPAITGTVTAVSQANGQTMLTVGGNQVPFSSITSVTGTSNPLASLLGG